MIRAAVAKAAQDKDDETLEFLTLEYPDIVHQMEREILNKAKKSHGK